MIPGNVLETDATTRSNRSGWSCRTKPKTLKPMISTGITEKNPTNVMPPASRLPRASP